MNIASSFANDVRAAYQQRRAQRTAAQVAAEQRAAREQQRAERKAFWRDVRSTIVGLLLATSIFALFLTGVYVATLNYISYFFGG